MGVCTLRVAQLGKEADALVFTDQMLDSMETTEEKLPQQRARALRTNVALLNAYKGAL